MHYYKMIYTKQLHQLFILYVYWFIALGDICTAMNTNAVGADGYKTINELPIPT